MQSETLKQFIADRVAELDQVTGFLNKSCFQEARDLANRLYKESLSKDKWGTEKPFILYRYTIAVPYRTLEFHSMEVVIVSPDDFYESTLRLLRFVRSAIFCFVFCVRTEAFRGER